MNKIKVCHLTSVHHRKDTRIFYKELPSLAMAGFEVIVIVADGKGDEQMLGYQIIDVGVPKNRLERILLSTRKVLKQAINLNAEIYHIHDPELLFVGKRLKRKGEKVIYDAHEDVPRQILSKYWIPLVIREFISSFAEKIENNITKKLDLVITATPFIRERFLKVNKNTIDINNFPILNREAKIPDWKSRKSEVCYIGSITEVRGIREMVLAMSELNNVILNLAGVFSHDEYKRRVENTEGWENIKEYGFVDRQQAAEIMSRSIAGLVTLHPIINYIDSLPVKMFEYMAAGLPVIASNFPLWKEIIEDNHCGFCIDPQKPEEITKAIQFILDNPDKAEEMGANGRRIVLERYHWAIDEKKLVSAYEKLIEK